MTSKETLNKFDLLYEKTYNDISKYVYIIKIESKNKLFAGKKFLLNLKK